MEDFKEYLERINEKLKHFASTRWVRVIILNLIALLLIIGLVFGSIGLAYSDRTSYAIGFDTVSGNFPLSISSVVISSLTLIWIFYLIKIDPNPNLTETKNYKIYRRWKLRYWVPTFFITALFEVLMWFFLNLWFGTPSVLKENQENIFYKKEKLWYWILTLGIGAVVDYVIFLTNELQSVTSYHWDLILFLALIAIGMNVTGIFAFQARFTFYTI